MRLQGFLVIPFLALILAGCAGGGGGEGAAGTSATGTSSSETGMPSMDMGGGERVMFGHASDPMDADLRVEVAQLDTYRFEPSTIEIEKGETVTFELTNQGRSPHEFVLGEEQLQAVHEMEMQQMSGQLMPDEPNAITLQPGEAKSLTWTFTEAGTVQYACHIAGHYAQGMVGTIQIAG